MKTFIVCSGGSTVSVNESESATRTVESRGQKGEMLRRRSRTCGSLGLVADDMNSNNVEKGLKSTSGGLWNLPNVLTMIRMAAIPMFTVLFYIPYPVLNNVSGYVFLGAGITDYLDGWIARRYGICTPFGAFLDPVADKLMVSMALLLLSDRLGALVAVCGGVTVCREIMVSALREWMANLGKSTNVKVSYLGKCKTACQMVALTILLLSAHHKSRERGDMAILAIKVGEILLIVSTVLALTSAKSYIQASWPYIRG